MISIYMIITALATTALAKGAMECNLSEPTRAQQCFGALGEPLIFYLPTSENTKLRLIKDDTYTILSITNNKVVTLNKEYIDHSAFFTNGTFKLYKAIKRDSGDYQLQTYAAAAGFLLHKINMHVEIQAPVSKPAVSQMCLSPEQMNISCSSEGDGVEFILSLDSQILTQTKAHSQSPSSWTADTLSLAGSTVKQDKLIVSNVSISLGGQLTGNLMCNVRNNVSIEETVIQLTNCKDSISHLPVVTVAVIASAVTLLLLLALCLGIRHLHKKTRPTTVNEGISAD